MGTKLIKWSQIAKAVGIGESDMYNFRMGAAQLLTKEQVKAVKAHIEADYKENMSFLTDAIKKAR